MAQMTKISLLSATLSLFIISIPLLGMHVPDHVNPRVNEIIAMPFNINPKINLPGGVITLNHKIIGFGCNKSVDALNQANIETQQGWPLVPVNVFIPDPKENANDPQTYTNWTENIPLIFKKSIADHLNKQITYEQEKLTYLLNGYDLTRANQAWWMPWDSKKDIAKSKAKHTIRDIKNFPAVMPVHLLCHSSKITINAFQKYKTTFTFNEHQELAELMEKFKTNDIATFSLLDSKLMKKIEKIEAQTRQGLTIDPRLSDATTRGLYRATMTTNANLIHNKVLDLRAYP